VSRLGTTLMPPWLKGYNRSWLSTDVVAGVTLAAVAIPEVMGYTAIAQTPIVTGLYTVIFPTMLFALLGSSRLLVVGADSATAALLAAGLTAAAINGVTPGSQEWLAYTSFVALICAGLLLIARVLRLGFLGDFLSSSVLVGFLTGVGVQVLTGQIPDMLGVPKGSGNWFQQQWTMITSIPDTNWVTFAFALGTLALIFGFKRFVPKVPGAIIAVVLRRTTGSPWSARCRAGSRRSACRRASACRTSAPCSALPSPASSSSSPSRRRRPARSR
jgi:MFS superfamily sulfate permease-like transporter